MDVEVISLDGFSVYLIQGNYYLSVKELMAYSHVKSKQRFLETITGYYGDLGVISETIKGEDCELIPVEMVMIKAMKGKSKYMLGLTKWLWGVFSLVLK